MAAMIDRVERRMAEPARADHVGGRTAWRDTQRLGRDLNPAGVRARRDHDRRRALRAGGQTPLDRSG
jgi:hypothetical protein